MNVRINQSEAKRNRVETKVAALETKLATQADQELVTANWKAERAERQRMQRKAQRAK